MCDFWSSFISLYLIHILKFSVQFPQFGFQLQLWSLCWTNSITRHCNALNFNMLSYQTVLYCAESRYQTILSCYKSIYQILLCCVELSYQTPLCCDMLSYKTPESTFLLIVVIKYAPLEAIMGTSVFWIQGCLIIQYIPRNMHTVSLCFALLWLCNRS